MPMVEARLQPSLKIPLLISEHEEQLLFVARNPWMVSHSEVEDTNLGLDISFYEENYYIKV